MGTGTGIEAAQPPSPSDALIEQSLSELLQRDWLAESEPVAQLVLTDAGSKHLRQLVREKKGHIPRLSSPTKGKTYELRGI
jgi:hypothetical protein